MTAIQPSAMICFTACAAATELTVIALQGDVRQLKDCEDAVAAATGKWGRLDILVNAAAGNFLAPAEVLSPKGFKTGVVQVLPIADRNSAFNQHLPQCPIMSPQHPRNVVELSA